MNITTYAREKTEYARLLKDLFNDGDITYRVGVALDTANTLSMVKFKKPTTGFLR